MPIENIVYVGAGSKFPSILMFDNLLNGNTPVIVSEFQKWMFCIFSGDFS